MRIGSWDDDGELDRDALNDVATLLAGPSEQTVGDRLLNRAIAFGEGLAETAGADGLERGSLYVDLGTVYYERAQRRAEPHIQTLITRIVTHRLTGSMQGWSFAQAAPDAVADLDRSVDLLTYATGHCAPGTEPYLYAAGMLGSGLVIRYLTRLPEIDAAGLAEALRWLRVVIDAAPDGVGSLSVNRKRLLMAAMVQQVWNSEPFAAVMAGSRRLPDTPDPRGLENVTQDMRLVERMLIADLDGTSNPDPMMLLMAAGLAHIQGPARSDDFKRYLQRAADAAARSGQNYQAIGMLARFLEWTETWAPRHLSSGRMDDLFRQLLGIGQELTGRDDLGSLLGGLRPDALWSSFSSAAAQLMRGESGQTEGPVQPPRTSSVLRVPGPDAGKTFTPPIPERADLDIDLNAAVLVGDGSADPFVALAGRVIEVLDEASATSKLDSTLASRHRIAVPALRALALHRRWLRERDGRDLVDAIALARHAAQEAATHPSLQERLTFFLANLLFDRYLLLGDRADLAAAHAVYTALLAGSPGTSTTAADDIDPDAAGNVQSLPEAIAALCDAEGVPELRALLPASFPAVTPEICRGELLAALAEAESRRSGAEDAHERAQPLLWEAFGLLPDGHARRSAVECELGRIEALRAARAADIPAFDMAVERTIAAARACHPDSSHRPALLLRATSVVCARVAATATQRPSPGDRAVESLDALIAELEAVARTPGNSYHGARARCLYGLGRLLHLRFLRQRAPADLDRALELLGSASSALHYSPGDPFPAIIHRALAQAYRSYAPIDAAYRRRAREEAAAVLTVHRETVLLQAGPRHGSAAARLVREDMMRLVRWCAEDEQWAEAVSALERGRGLVLHAATVAADVPALLHRAGHPDLAERWTTADSRPDDPAPTAQPDGSATLSIPDSLRRSALEALDGTAAEQLLLSAPTVETIAAALRGLGADALVYLIAGNDAAPGYALIVYAEPGRGSVVEAIRLSGLADDAGGVLSAYISALEDLNSDAGEPRPGTESDVRSRERSSSAATRRAESFTAWESALERLCAWAGESAMADVLETVRERTPGRLPRIVLAPSGTLGLVPWHAAYVTARRGTAPPKGTEKETTARRACQEAVISHCATARQLIEAANRHPASPGGVKAMIVDPAGSHAMRAEAGLIRWAFYPQCTVVGRLAWDEDEYGSWSGPAPAEASLESVLPLLPGRGASSASMLIANCHAFTAQSAADSFLQFSSQPRRTLSIEWVLADAHHRDGTAPGTVALLVDCGSDLAMAEYDESLTLATAFLAAGAGSVIGARWPIDDGGATTILMFMFHHFLKGREEPLDPAAEGSPVDALCAAQRWMLDPQRKFPKRLIAGLPKVRRMPPEAFQATAVWAAFTHHGR